MTTNTKTRSAMVEEIELSGVVKYANLITPMGFDPTTETFSADAEKVTFGLTLLMKPEDAQLAGIQKLNKKAIELERGRLPKEKQIKLKDVYLEFSDDVDKEGNPTGMVLVRTKRNGAFDPPLVADRKGHLIERDKLRYGTEVKVKVKAYSYTVANKVGLSLGLNEVQVVSEPEFTRTSSFKSLDEELGSDIDLTASPF